MSGLHQFFSLQIISTLSYMCALSSFLCVSCLILRRRLGPVAQFHENSKYYSAIPPAPNKAVDSNLPHISVELPVYKESLKETM